MKINKKRLSKRVNSSEKQSDESALSIADQIKDGITAGIYNFVDKRGRSEIWDFFSKIANENGELLPDVVACKICFAALKFTGSTSNLGKHKCYLVNSSKMRKNTIEVNDEKKEEGANIATEWIIRNCRPLKIIEDSGLKKFGEYLINVGATFGPNVDIDKLFPQPATIASNITTGYDEHFDTIKAEIEKFKASGYAITTDTWTDSYSQTSFLSCTVHYVKEAVLVGRLLAMKSVGETFCTGLNIRGSIEEILQDFGCDLTEDKPTIVTDPGSDVIKALDDLEKINCANHLLSNAVENAIDAVPDMLNLITNCNKLVKYLKKSGINVNLEVPLNSYCPALRWITAYYQLKSIEANWEDITAGLMEKNKMEIIDGIKINQLGLIVRLLGTFEEVSQRLESTKRPTIHLAVPNFHKLKIFCQIAEDDFNILKALKSALHAQITSNVMPNLSKLHNIALFLFPPTNKLKQFSSAERESIINDTKHIMKDFFQHNVSNNPEMQKPKTKLYDKFVNFNEFDEFVDFTKGEPHLDQVQQEITGYSNMNVKYTLDFNVLAWWSLQKHFFPLLYETSCKVFCIPATSAASQRTFSSARDLFTENPSLVAANADHINQTMFLHSNLK